MQKYVPIEKMSKKAKKELAKRQRGTWGNINPTTRLVPNKKHYNRKKVQKGEDFRFEPFFLPLLAPAFSFFSWAFAAFEETAVFCKCKGRFAPPAGRQWRLCRFWLFHAPLPPFLSARRLHKPLDNRRIGRAKRVLAQLLYIHPQKLPVYHALRLSL